MRPSMEIPVTVPRLLTAFEWLQGPTWGLAEPGQSLHWRLRLGECIHLLLPTHLCAGYAQQARNICLHG